MEIITGIKRRRRWRDEDKVRIVAEAEQPDACFADVARRHKISCGLSWDWRQVRRGALAWDAAPVFMQPRITAEPHQNTPPRSTTRSSPRTMEAAHIETALPDGTCIGVSDDVCPTALRRVVSALRR